MATIAFFLCRFLLFNVAFRLVFCLLSFYKLDLLWNISLAFSNFAHNSWKLVAIFRLARFQEAVTSLMFYLVSSILTPRIKLIPCSLILSILLLSMRSLYIPPWHNLSPPHTPLLPQLFLLFNSLSGKPLWPSPILSNLILCIRIELSLIKMPQIQRRLNIKLVLQLLLGKNWMFFLYVLPGFKLFDGAAVGEDFLLRESLIGVVLFHVRGVRDSI